MIFDKDYLFETEETKKKKFRIRIFVSFCIFFIIFVFAPMCHHYYANRLIIQSQEKYFQNPPDLIAVFTGGRGRIERALELSQEHPSSKILISGVYNKNTLEILLNRFLKKSNNPEQSLDYYSRIIELDFKALNTYGNVEETLKFLEQNKTYKKVLFVSSDYHLPRINLLLRFMRKPKRHKIEYYFDGVSTSNVIDYLINIYVEQLKGFKLIVF